MKITKRDFKEAKEALDSGTVRQALEKIFGMEIADVVVMWAKYGRTTTTAHIEERKAT